jgi:hypothetical protein
MLPRGSMAAAFQKAWINSFARSYNRGREGDVPLQKRTSQPL